MTYFRYTALLNKNRVLIKDKNRSVVTIAVKRDDLYIIEEFTKNIPTSCMRVRKTI